MSTTTRFRMIGTSGTLAFLAGAALAPSAFADVAISPAATQNMSCSGGVCSPTASDAVLNVGDLETLLATGNVEVTTTGSDKVQANNIDVDTALSWSDASALSLIAYNAITVNQGMSVAGPGGLSLSTPNNMLYSFAGKGRVAFQNLSSQLIINGTAFTLVNNIKSLASAIANNPSGAYALADNYDASADGTYGASPIQTVFDGAFEGLGNAISRLSIAYNSQTPTYVGFFEFNDGTIRDVALLHCNVTVAKPDVLGGIVGGLAAWNGGSMLHVFVSGTIRSDAGAVGGVVGANGSTIVDSSADVRIINSQPGSTVGDLAGDNSSDTGNISQSFAEGAISITGDQEIGGGILGTNWGFVQNSYATGAVSGGKRSVVGGLVGENSETNGVGALIETSYSTGAVSGGRHSLVGGYAGTVFEPSRKYNRDTYWDVDTSGTEQGTGKGNEKGIIGLTTQELQSGLPKGFDPTIWAEDPKINNGFPYLIANPPRE